MSIWQIVDFSWIWWSLFACCAVAGLVLAFRRKSEFDLPPGRLGWPLLGAVDVIQGKRTLLQHFLSLYHQHGTPLISIRLAGTYIISLNEYDVIKEVMQMREMRQRGNLTLMRVDPEYRGVIHCSGELWQEHRRFCLRTLRDFGMGRSDGETLIKNEIKHLLAHVKENLGKPVDTGALLSPAVNNTTCLFLFNQRYDYDDHFNFDRLRELDRLMMTIIPMWKPFVYTSKLMHIPGDLFGYKESRRRLNTFYKFIEERIEEKRDVEDGSFISAFMKERKNDLSGKGRTTFTDDQLKYTIMDIFMAGTDTTTTFLRWAILLLAQHPKLQLSLQHELFKNMSSDEASMHDRQKLRLVEAFILEVHRYASISPIGLPHSPLADMAIRGYRVPKGSSVFANIYAVHRDPGYWKNADQFDVTNFLDENGDVVHHQRLIPFSIGKRSCVGEALAKMKIFLILVNLIQKFRFKLAQPLDSLDGNMEGMNYPPPHEVIITERKVFNGPQERD